MKNLIYKRICLLVTFIIITTVFGCQKENSWSFIDLSNNETPNAKDYVAIQEAQKRADKYVIVENGRYKLTITSGVPIEVSKRLFDIAIVRAIEIANRMIDNGDMYIYDRSLIEVGSEPIIITRAIGNIWGVEDRNIIEESYDRSWAGTTHTVRFNQAGAREYYNSNYAGSPSATFFSGVISIGIGYVTSVHVGAIFGLWGTTDATLMQSIGGRVLDASNRGSISIEEMTINGDPWGNVSTTIRDCNGTVIGQFNH